jgi:hypothetical protein
MLYFEFEEGKKGIEKSQERRIGVRSKDERLGKRAGGALYISIDESVSQSPTSSPDSLRNHRDRRRCTTPI